MGRKYKQGVCERCGHSGYANDHHIVPKAVKKDENRKTIRLCLNCHTEIHEKLPEEVQEEAFYYKFTHSWLSGLLILLFIFGALFLVL